MIFRELLKMINNIIILLLLHYSNYFRKYRESRKEKGVGVYGFPQSISKET
jgi:hypothetical protein